MSFLSDADMNAISQQLADAGFFPDICAVTRAPAVMSGGLPNADDWISVGSFGCRVEQPSPGRPFPGIPEGSTVDRIIAFRLDRDVGNADRLGVNGETYDVLDTNASNSFRFEHVTLCQKVVE